MSTPNALRHAFVEALRSDWQATARPNQLPPPGNWRVWLLMSGRGFGKTEAGAQWIRSLAEAGAAPKIALIGQTVSAVREVMVDRILAIAPPLCQPTYEASRARLVWPNGVTGLCYSADQPERLRGPQHAAAWIDELASFRYADEVWSTLLLGLRIGSDPRIVVTTTPRPTRLIRDLVSREGQDVTITRGATRENAANLAPAFLAELASRYENTRLGKQELEGELLEDTPGAIFTHDILDATRVDSAPEMQRIVIGVDPAGSTAEGRDETGLVTCGLGLDCHGYILADDSGRYAPHEWARKAVGAFYAWKADRIVVERNFGGEMCKATIESIDASVPVKEINSSRGKTLRAEPVSNLFEQRRCHIVGQLDELEDQMTHFTSDWQRSIHGSPDRLDAAIFALNELMLGQPVGGFFKEASLLVRGEPVDGLPRFDKVFSVVCSSDKSSPERDAVAVVYFAYTAHNSYPLIILDWHLEPYTDTAPRVSDIKHYVETLCMEVHARAGYGGIWIDSLTPIGAALLHQGGEGLIDISEELKGDLSDHVAAAARFIGSGSVKISRAAHEKISAFRGTTKNHLLGQVLSFRLGETLEESELLEAFVIGVRLALEHQSGLSPWAVL